MVSSSSYIDGQIKPRGKDQKRLHEMARVMKQLLSVPNWMGLSGVYWDEAVTQTCYSNFFPEFSTGKRHGTIILDPLNIYLMLLKWWHKQDCLYPTWQREINLFLHWSISLQYDGLINEFFDPEVRPIIIKQLHCHLHSCNTNWFLAHRTFYWCNENIYKFKELF